MNKLTILVAALGITSTAFAFDDYATVKKIEPQYSSVNQPIEVCRDEVVQETRYPQQQPQYQQAQPQDRNYGGAALGAVAGGILGHQVGKGTGNTVATAAGAVIGALVGDNMSNSNNGNVQYQQQPQYQPQPQVYNRTVRNCHMEDNMTQVLSGYKVDYIYNGKTFSYTAQEKPASNKIRVDVQVQPSLY